MSNEDENIFFIIDDKKEDDSEIDYDKELYDYLNNYNTENNQNHDLYISQKINYQTNFTVKELLLICDYYGIAKQLKAAKCNKEDVVTVLVNFEMDPANFEIVTRRKKIWFYMSELKNDKYMKKYILWSNMYYS
jgi:hypothetical protein